MGCVAGAPFLPPRDGPLATTPPDEPQRDPGPLRRLARIAILYNVRTALRVVLQCVCGARVAGEERVPLRGGLVVAANHLSFADPVILQTYVPRFLTYLMTDKFYYAPVLHGLVAFWGVLVVKRQGLNKEALRAAGGILAAGGAVGIFPEGGISRDGLVHDAQPGLALLAQRARVPILPVGIAGTERLLAPDTFRLRRARLGLYLGELIRPAGQDRQELARQVTAALRLCAERARAL